MGVGEVRSYWGRCNGSEQMVNRNLTNLVVVREVFIVLFVCSVKPLDLG